MSRTVVVYTKRADRVPIDQLLDAMRRKGVTVAFRPSNPKKKVKPDQWTGGAFVVEGSDDSFVTVTALPLTAREKKDAASDASKVADPAVAATLAGAQAYYAFSLSEWPDLLSLRLAASLVDALAEWSEVAVYDSDVNTYTPPRAFVERLEAAAATRGQA